MKDREITITLKEFKELKDMIIHLTQENEYWKGQYELLAYAYNSIVQPEEEVKVKQKIGFN